LFYETEVSYQNSFSLVSFYFIPSSPKSLFLQPQFNSPVSPYCLSKVLFSPQTAETNLSVFRLEKYRDIYRGKLRLGVGGGISFPLQILLNFYTDILTLGEFRQYKGIPPPSSSPPSPHTTFTMFSKRRQEKG
jgi:hypothetical protein